MNINDLSQDSGVIALKNHLQEENERREFLLMKKNDFKNIKNNEDLDNFLKEYKEDSKYVSQNIFSNEKSFMYEYLFENNQNDKNNVESAIKYSISKNDKELLNKCLEQDSSKELLADNHKKNFYLKISKDECTEILLDKLEFSKAQLSFKLNEDLDYGNFNNVNKLIELGADKDKAFLELSGGNKFNAVNYLVDNQNFSKEVLEQGLMNSIKKGILTDNNEEDINIFNTAEDINFSFKQEDTNVFSNLYSRFEFSKETYEKAIKEAIKENKYELVTEILKDTKLTMKESDLQEIQNVDKEQYETINKIN